MTRIIKSINVAIDALNQDNVVAIPTETVYGLAADISNERAMRKIFEIKNRPLNHPLIMHVCPDWDLTQWVLSIPAYAYQLMEAFWPGPLTLIFNLKPNAVGDLVTGGQHTVAIRAPKHAVALDLLRQFNRPLVAPSANPFGQTSPTTAFHVADSFPEDNFLILDGGRCQVGIESTIVDATAHDQYRILRSGGVDLHSLDLIAGERSDLNETAVRAPGQLESHYKPRKPLYYIKNVEDIYRYFDADTSLFYLIGFTKDLAAQKRGYYRLSSSAAEAAYELYYELRRADASDANFIVIELPPENIDWLAIQDRIIKAGQPILSMKT